MKKYTEQEFELHDLSDVVCFITSSLFLAPFRFCNTITSKVLFLPNDILKKIVIFAIGFNGILLSVNIFFRILQKDWNPLSGSIPLLTYAISIGFLAFIYLFFTRRESRSININEEHVPQKKDDIFSVNDNDLLEETEPPAEIHEDYLKENAINTEKLEEVLFHEEPSPEVLNKLNELVTEDPFNLADIQLVPLDEQEDLLNSVESIEIPNMDSIDDLANVDEVPIF